MKKITTTVLIISLLLGFLIVYPALASSSPQNTYTGFSQSMAIADFADEFKNIPTDYVIYDDIIGLADEKKTARFTKAYFNDLGTYLFLAVEDGKKSANGYIIVHSQDVDSWISYYGNTSNSTYINFIKSELTEVKVVIDFETVIFYNHAEVAQITGGSPGKGDQVPIYGEDNEGKTVIKNYKSIVTGTKKYNSEQKHKLDITTPTEIKAGTPVNITLDSTDGSIFITRHQTWVFSVRHAGVTKNLINYGQRHFSKSHSYEEIFSHTFDTAGTYILSFAVEDASYHNNTRTGDTVYSIQKTVEVLPADENPVDPNPTDPDPPQEYNITGDFDILPSNSINWRDSFTFKPKDFVISQSCTYLYHEYRLARGTAVSRSANVGNMNADTTYSYSNYPYAIGIGSHDISIKVAARCDGEIIQTDWMANKTLNIAGPANNSPPVFDAGFFNEPDIYSYQPPHEVVIDSKVNLRIIKDDRFDPETPYDPDGDPIYYTWNFLGSTSSWIRSIHDDQGGYVKEETYRYIIADELGRHCVSVTANDPYGGASTRNVCINVIPPNPIPIIDAPNSVVEGRPLPSPISGTRSYSPMKRSISQYIWENKKDVYSTPGMEKITLSVVDSAGLASLGQATHNLTVRPDLPPVAQLEYINIGIRNTPISFRDTSYSPDGDTIVTHTNRLVCDRNNNGSFTDDTISSVTKDSNGVFSYTPTQVGDCAVLIYLEEDWGKTAEKEFLFTVVNEAPEVDFSAKGVNPEPPNITTIAPSMNTIMNSPEWTASSITQNYVWKDYHLVGSNTLETSQNKNVQPYRSISTNNITLSEQSLERHYCEGCGNEGSINGVFYNFDPENRIDKRLWWKSYHNKYYLYDEDRPGTSYTHGYHGPIFSTLKEQGSSVIINKDINMIWQRFEHYNTWTNIYTFTDNLYRISDVRSYTPGDELYYDATHSLESYDTNTTTLYTTDQSQAEIPPMPSSFTKPTTVLNEKTMVVTNKQGSTGMTGPNGAVNSNYIKDFEGNNYKNNCILIGRWYSPESCELAKYNANGSKIWGYTRLGTHSHLVVDHISSDNSKIIVEDAYNDTYKIINNNNGNVISTFSMTMSNEILHPSYTSRSSKLYYLGVYDDTVAYISQTVEEGIANTVGKKGFWELRFYDLVTGATTSAGNIKTYVGVTHKYNSEYYRYVNPVPMSVISGDGKLLIANYYSNVLIYDMKTYVKEGDIVTGIDPENRYDDEQYSSSDTKTYHSIKDMNLTEDGRLKIVYRYNYRHSSSGSDSDDRDEKVLTIQTTPFSSANSHSYGYITNEDILYNGDVSINLKFKKNTFSDTSSAGIGFRSQDHKNMYRAEVSTSGIKLVKIVEGTATDLGSTAYSLIMNRDYNLKVKVRGSRVTLYMNGVPILNANDDTFASGNYGLFAEVPYVVLKDFSAALHEPNDSEVENQAIVNMPITFTKSYSDLEGDPLIEDKTSWTFTNLEPHKFLDVGDGTSDPAGTNSYDGVVVQEPSPSLTKVGVYKVDLVETDDPAPPGYKHPNTAFENMQKESYPASHEILVHRRPISNFSLSITSSDTVAWVDHSYDPDRWLSASNYSTENTGINYRTTKGILEKRFSHTDPNGVTHNTKLVVPTMPGIYTVRMAVKDEYGAWSDWHDEDIEIIEVPTNAPPEATITYPTGSQTSPTMSNVLRPVITWNQTDPDPGTVFAGYQLQIRNESDGLILDTGELAQNRTATNHSYTPSYNLPAGQKIKVRVRVSDGDMWSEWSSYKWIYINRAPTANFDWSPKPVWEGDNVTLQHQVGDPDNDTLQVRYTVTRPNGTQGCHPSCSSYYSLTSAQYNASGPTFQATQPGTYTIVQTVSDGIASTVTRTKSLLTNENTLTINILHSNIVTPPSTTSWESYRVSLGRNQNVFFAGEPFIPIATTSSNAVQIKANFIFPVASVKVSQKYSSDPYPDFKGISSLTSTNNINWSGIYGNASKYYFIPDGNYNVRFTATYLNGTTKTEDYMLIINESGLPIISIVQ